MKTGSLDSQLDIGYTQSGVQNREKYYLDNRTNNKNGQTKCLESMIDSTDCRMDYLDG